MAATSLLFVFLLGLVAGTHAMEQENDKDLPNMMRSGEIGGEKVDSNARSQQAHHNAIIYCCA